MRILIYCRLIFIYSIFLLAADGVNIVVVVLVLCIVVILLLIWLLACVVWGCMWKKKNTKNGKT